MIDVGLSFCLLPNGYICLVFQSMHDRQSQYHGDYAKVYLLISNGNHDATCIKLCVLPCVMPPLECNHLQAFMSDIKPFRTDFQECFIGVILVLHHTPSCAQSLYTYTPLPIVRFWSSENVSTPFTCDVLRKQQSRPSLQVSCKSSESFLKHVGSVRWGSAIIMLLVNVNLVSAYACNRKFAIVTAWWPGNPSRNQCCYWNSSPISFIQQRKSAVWYQRICIKTEMESRSSNCHVNQKIKMMKKRIKVLERTGCSSLWYDHI